MQSFEKEKIKITTGTKEWADSNVNCIKGCYNNCRYCYAKVMARRFSRIIDNNWALMTVNDSSVIKKYPQKTGRIMFPSTHDIFDLEPYKSACFKVLESLLTAENEVLITTKPRLKVIKEIIGRFDNFKEQIQFRFTITSKDDKLLRFWEPNAPSFKERFGALQLAFANGYKTSVSIEPFLDYNPLPLINQIEYYVTESIWLGKMNYITKQGLSEEEKIFYDNVRKNYELSHLKEIIKQVSKNPKIRLKDSIKNKGLSV
jgi:DNA repair photolyase